MPSTKFAGALVVLTVGLLAGAQQASADEYVVRNTNDSGPDSFRAAIQATNAHAGADVIRFEIPNVGASPHVIAPLSDLDSIDERVAIDGYSQPGTATARRNSPAELRVVIDASAVNRGLELASDESVVRGLVVQNAVDDGIRVQGDRNLITGNYVGSDADGVLAAGNTGDGIELTGDGNIVGGSTPQDLNLISDNDGGVAIVGSQNLVLGNAIGTDVTMTQALGNYEGVEINGGGNRVGGSTRGEGNVISGNQQAGVRVESGTGSEIYGNLLGTDRTGSASVTLGQDGVLVEEASAANLIGGPTPGEGNLISGNDNGVELQGDENVVQGNLIGTTTSGDAVLENDDHGVSVSGDDNLIGGPGDTDGNVVSGNGLNGIKISERVDLSPEVPHGNRVEGNLIGTNDDGTAPLPNGWSGVEIVDVGSNTVGGLETGMGNVIAGNDMHGVRIWRFDAEDHASSNKVLGNAIGTDAAGSRNLGNAESGVFIEGGDDTHVGDASEAGANTIAFNGNDGVTVVSGQDNSIERNSIFSNGDLGIDLGDDGPTNDDGALDLDTGPNGLQNYPQFTFYNVLGQLTFTLDSLPSQSFWLDFYANRDCNDPEGRTFLARVRVTTDANGHAAGTTDIGHPTTVTATATLKAPSVQPPPRPRYREADPVPIPMVNSTSEFSPCLVLPPPIADH